MQLKINNILNLLNNKYYLYLLLFIWTLTLRLPYVFIDKISPDENIFIILGDLITQNELPHDNYWDIKPTLVWYLYSLPLFFFKSIASVRIYGILVIFLSAVFLFKIIKKKEGQDFVAFLTSFLFVFASTFVGTELPNHSIGIGVVVITQHFANFFLIMSIFFLIKRRSNLNIFYTSLFICLALLTRYNYLLIVFGFLYYYFAYNKHFQFIIIFLLTLFTSFLITHITYFSEARFNDLTEYFFILSQYGSENSLTQKFFSIKKFLRFAYEPLFYFTLTNTRFYLSLLLWLSGFLYLFLFTIKKKNKIDNFIMIIFLLLSASITSGYPAEHYLLSLVVLVSYFSAKIITHFNYRLFRFLPIIILIITTLNTIKSEYLWLGARIYNKQDIMIGPGYNVYNFIIKNNLPLENNLYLSQPIIYFLTNQKPIHKLIFPTQFNAHATTISKFDNPAKLYESLFREKPNLIVFDENQWNIKSNIAIYEIVKNEISKNYSQLYQTQSTKLYITK